MSYSKKVLSALSAIILCLALTAKTSSAAPIQALIVTGQSNHNWRISTPVVKQILEQTNLFHVDIAISPGENADGYTMDDFKPNFAAYDVVVLNYVGDLWSEQIRKAFVDYVSNGGGVVAFHSACNAFPQWKEYNTILGLGGWGGRDERWGPYIRWRGGKVIRDYTPGQGGTHPSKHVIEIVTRAPEHPVMKGLPRMWLHARDGFNIRMRGPAKNLTVLATAYSDVVNDGGTGENEPMIFTINYGKGRVFHTLMGHAKSNSRSLECVGFITTFQRGAEWAATGKVTQKIPKDFPTATEVRRWRYFREPKQNPNTAGPTVQFEKISSSVREKTGPVEIGVTLSAACEKTVSVLCRVTDGTADDDEDYAFKPTTVVFPPNTTTRKVAINLKADNEHEAPETIVLQLQQPDGATLGARTQHTLTIDDNYAKRHYLHHCR